MKKIFIIIFIITTIALLSLFSYQFFKKEYLIKKILNKDLPLEERKEASYYLLKNFLMKKPMSDRDVSRISTLFESDNFEDKYIASINLRYSRNKLAARILRNELKKISDPDEDPKLTRIRCSSLNNLLGDQFRKKEDYFTGEEIKEVNLLLRDIIRRTENYSEVFGPCQYTLMKLDTKENLLFVINNFKMKREKIIGKKTQLSEEERIKYDYIALDTFSILSPREENLLELLENGNNLEAKFASYAFRFIIKYGNGYTSNNSKIAFALKERYLKTKDLEEKGYLFEALCNLRGNESLQALNTLYLNEEDASLSKRIYDCIEVKKLKAKTRKTST